MFLRNILTYSGANLFSQATQGVQNLVVRRFLSPSAMGIWNRVLVIQGFVATFDPGLSQAAARELPLLRGAGQDAEEQAVRSTAGWARLLQGLFFAAGILIAAAWGKHGAAGPPIAAAMLVVALTWSDTVAIFCQSAQCYAPLSCSIVIAACFSLAVVPLAAKYWGVHGMMVAEVTVTIVQGLLLTALAQAAGVRLTAAFDWRILRRLALFGLPLRAVDYPLAILMILDGLAIARFRPAAELALYATAQMLFAIGADIPSRIGNVLLARIYNLSGAKTDRAKLGDELRRYLLIQQALFMPAVITTMWWAAQLVIRMFLPKYIPALEIAAVLLVGIYYVPTSTLLRNFWIIDQRLWALLASNLVGLAAGAAAILCAAGIGHWRLTWVAGGMVGAYACHFAILLVSIGRSLWGARGAAMVGARAAVAGAWVGLLLHGLAPDWGRLVGARERAI